MPDRLMSVSDVAKSVGLSRQRFHQLMKEGVFPPPVYDIRARRPHYTEEMQRVCATVREKNVGINGRVVLFYARHPRPSLAKKQIRPRRSVPPRGVPKDNRLLDGLRGLGLATVTNQQIETALKELYPGGTAGVGEGELLRTVFVHLMRRH